MQSADSSETVGKIKRALELRSEGLTYKQIGQSIGISSAYVQQLLRRAKVWQLEDRPEWAWGLQPWLYEWSTKGGYTSKEQIVDALKKGRLDADSWVWKWAGLEKPKRQERKCTRSIERAIKLLQRRGYKVICPST